MTALHLEKIKVLEGLNDAVATVYDKKSKPCLSIVIYNGRIIIDQEPPSQSVIIEADDKLGVTKIEAHGPIEIERHLLGPKGIGKQTRPLGVKGDNGPCPCGCQEKP